MGDNRYTQRRHGPYLAMKARKFGAPHRNYRQRRYSGLAKQILRSIHEKKRVADIVAEFQVPRSTVYSWITKSRTDSNWSPQTTRCGQHRRIFTVEEEDEIAARIRDEFLSKHLMFSDADCREILLNEYAKKLEKDPKFRVPFTCSDGYISNFKKRNGFSSRWAHLKRRSPVDAERCSEWKTLVKDLLRTRDNRLILNCDETFWRVFPGALMTWADTNSENVTIDINGSEKQGLTVLATIAADNTKLPLFFIASGKTQLCEASQIDPKPGDWTSHTTKGWQTSESFQKYLMHLREEFGDAPLDLILDLHSSHRTSDVKTLAESLDITLHYIPAGATDQLQPLDRRVFGALKAIARRLFRQRSCEKRTLKQACADLREAWENLGTDTLEEAWDCY